MGAADEQRIRIERGRQELRELLEEAGFRRVRTLWEKSDEDGEGTGEFYEPKKVGNEASWWTYMIAER